jgi:hypothetical protein
VAATGGSETLETKATSVESATTDLLSTVGGTENLELLLPEYPEIGSTIDYNKELKTVESGCHRMKDEIIETHNDL